MPDDAPKLSVVMPVHNTDLYLEEAIQSILNQTFQAYEFIIINDGSTDHSGAIIDDYAKKDRRIVAIHQPHKGLIGSLNSAISLVNTSFIARMDADDISLPARLECQYRYMIERPDIAVLGTAVRYIHSSHSAIPSAVDQRPMTPTELTKWFKRGDCPVVHPTVMMRKDIFDEVGGYSPAYIHAEDFELWIRIARRYRIMNLRDALLYVRLHSHNTSRQHALQQAFSATVAEFEKGRNTVTFSSICPAYRTEIIRQLMLTEKETWAFQLHELKKITDGLSHPKGAGPQLEKYYRELKKVPYAIQLNQAYCLVKTKFWFARYYLYKGRIFKALSCLLHLFILRSLTFARMGQY
ncbi:MAG: glycosyltransferase [Kiritimatiellae bacterium]|nr:glycosyltransferase [Kiritimatiellia bacterium]